MRPTFTLARSIAPTIPLPSSDGEEPEEGEEEEPQTQPLPARPSPAPQTSSGGITGSNRGGPKIASAQVTSTSAVKSPAIGTAIPSAGPALTVQALSSILIPFRFSRAYSPAPFPHIKQKPSAPIASPSPTPSEGAVPSPQTPSTAAPPLPSSPSSPQPTSAPQSATEKRLWDANEEFRLQLARLLRKTYRAPLPLAYVLHLPSFLSSLTPVARWL